MKRLLPVMLLAGCVAEPVAQISAARIIAVDGVSYTVEQKDNVPYLQYYLLPDTEGRFEPTGETGRAVWVTGPGGVLDGFRVLSVFCNGVDPGPPAPDAPDTDMVPTVPGTETLQFEGACN
jgi:hypothetical protein